MPARVRLERHRRLLLGAGVGVVALGIAVATVLFVDCEVCEAANQIILQGRVAQNCTITVNASAGASNLPLTAAGPQRVQVGTVTQSCNKKAGYDLEIRSENCRGSPSGAKLVATDTQDAFLVYTAEFNNPTTGGSNATVTGLLSQGCDTDDGREVRNAVISNEVSTVFVNFIGSANLVAGTYRDTLTISMNVK